MMFVAGGLMWANVYAQGDSILDDFPRFGWPYRAIYKNSFEYLPETHWFSIRWDHWVYYFVTKALIYNALVAVSLLMVIYFLCERLIRRRAARKEA